MFVALATILLLNELSKVTPMVSKSDMEDGKKSHSFLGRQFLPTKMSNDCLLLLNMHLALTDVPLNHCKQGLTVQVQPPDAGLV